MMRGDGRCLGWQMIKWPASFIVQTLRASSKRRMMAETSIDSFDGVVQGVWGDGWEVG